MSFPSYSPPYLQGVVPQTMTWYLPILERLNML